MLKRVFSLLLSVLLVFGAIPVLAYAETTETTEVTEAVETTEVTESVESSEPAEVVESDEEAFQRHLNDAADAPEAESFENLVYPEPASVMSESGVSSRAVGSYTMSESESNNSTSTADRIYNDYTVSGRLSSYDLDYFKFVLSSSAKISVVSVANYSSTVFSLYNSSGKIVTTSTSDGYTSGGYAAQAMVKTLSAGTYYLVFLNTKNYTDTYTFYFSTTTTSSHSHSYSSKVTAPTCTSSGYTTYTCSCGYSYTSNSVSATGHSYGSYVSDNNGAPDSEGTKSATCSNCGAKNTVADTGVYLPDVQMLTPVGHSTGNIIKWEAVEGAALYQVYRLDGSAWKLLKNTGGTAYKDESAPAGTKCYYKVVARNGDLKSSMAIPSVSVTRPALITSLDNVTITKITAHTTGNIIYWNAVDNATLYQVYRLNGSAWELLKNTGSTAYKDETAAVGVKVYYKIVARRDSIASNIGTTVSASATRPAPITSLSNVTITSINAHATGNIIYWNAVTNAKLYQVYRLNGSSWELLKNTGGTAYKDETAPCGVKTYYKIVARCDSMASNISTTASSSAVRPHSYSITDSKDVTCTSNGYTTYTCSVCSHSYTNTVTASGHSWVDATCTKPKTCSSCSATSGSALGHQGTDLTCQRCGNSTFEDLVYTGRGDKLIENIVLPKGTYRITVKNPSSSRYVFTYMYNWGESSWDNYIGTPASTTKQEIFTGSLNGYIEVDCGDTSSYWTLTITRLA